MKALKKCIIFLMAFSCTLGLLEIFLSFSEIITKSLNHYDDGFGRARRANADFLDLNEGFGMGSFNQYGFLGPGYPTEKSEGVIRIALIGDSYVEGFQVFDRHHMRYLMERKLSVETNRVVEIMNFGRSGIGFLDMFAIDNLFVQKFNPDITIYFVDDYCLQSAQTDKLLPIVNIINDKPIIQVPQNLNSINSYKKQLYWLQKSSLIMMGRNVINLMKNKNLFFKKLFDKFYFSVSEEKNLLKTGRNEYLFIIEELRQQNKFIVNRGWNSLALPEYYNDMVILNVDELLRSNEEYDLSYHYWKGSGKTGHWNHLAHEVISKALCEIIENMERVNLKFIPCEELFGNSLK
jgi:hypothetical protein